jgi:serine/threonine protein phosphatase 1
MPRTLAIGDIHGDLEQLDRLLGRLPALSADDTVVFLGDYLDRGPSSRGVIERIVAFRAAFPGRCVLLRGNHEDAWLQSLRSPNIGFLLPEGNGCLATMTSLLDCAHLSTQEKVERLLQPSSWFPTEIRQFLETLQLWYEDEHAIYVHAGLDGEGDVWLHPSQGGTRNLMWMREKDFFSRYRGKLVIFGHTPTSALIDLQDDVSRFLDGPGGVFRGGDLIGLDTGCGKGGFLSAIELPSGTVYDSRA